MNAGPANRDQRCDDDFGFIREPIRKSVDLRLRLNKDPAR